MIDYRWQPFTRERMCGTSLIGMRPMLDATLTDRNNQTHNDPPAFRDTAADHVCRVRRVRRGSCVHCK